MSLLNQGQIEAAIVHFSDNLEADTRLFAELLDEAAQVEADYKLAEARSKLNFIATARRMTVDERQARTLIEVDGLYRAHLLLDARVEATKASLRTNQGRLDAYRTLAANVRNQT